MNNSLCQVLYFCAFSFIRCAPPARPTGAAAASSECEGADEADRQTGAQKSAERAERRGGAWEGEERTTHWTHWTHWTHSQIHSTVHQRLPRFVNCPSRFELSAYIVSSMLHPSKALFYTAWPRPRGRCWPIRRYEMCTCVCEEALEQRSTRSSLDRESSVGSGEAPVSPAPKRRGKRSLVITDAQEKVSLTLINLTLYSSHWNLSWQFRAKFEIICKT